MLVQRIARAAAVTLALGLTALMLLARAGAQDLPASVGGSVLTAQGAPLAGVTVTLVALADGQAVTTTTALDGSYWFTVTAAGGYLVAPSLLGRYFTPPDRSWQAPADYLTADFIGADDPAILSLSGRVQTAAGAAIDGATVRAQAVTGAIVSTTATAHGAFAVGAVITGVYTLTASAPTHYFPAAVVSAPPSQFDLRLTGAPYATVRGVVRDAGAAPLAGITVTAVLTPPVEPAPSIVQARTDASGAYTLTQLTAGRYRITPQQDNYHFAPPWRELRTPPDAVAVDFTGTRQHTAFLPLMHRPPPDLSVRHIEVTQATQNDANSIPLVAGRPTLARVYAAVANAATVPDIWLELTATRDGQFLGTVRAGPGVVWANPQRGRYETTFNVPLPPGWLAGAITLRGTVDPDNVFLETEEGNNSRAFDLTFHAMPPLRVKWVPINYTHLPTGAYYPGRWDAEELAFARQVFPLDQVEVTVRSPLDFSGDLRTHEDWSALLRAVANLKFADAAPAQELYYGLIPLGPEDNVPVIYGGLGFVGMRAAIGLVSTPETTAHEIGHNLGLLHAPCGNPSAVDASYPYSNAQIGEYGVDVAEGRLLAPGLYRDLMSYCGPRWISDYHYLKVFQNQQAAVRSQPPAGPGLWVRVQLEATGAAQLLPVYALHAPPTAPALGSPYTVELLDAKGAVIATQPLALLTAAEGGPPVEMLSAIVPRPAVTVAAVRVTAGRATLAARTLDGAAAPRTMLAPRGAAPRLTWQPAAQPALVRYSADGGATWTALGVDLTGGQAAIPPGLRADELLWEVTAGQ